MFNHFQYLVYPSYFVVNNLFNNSRPIGSAIIKLGRISTKLKVVIERKLNKKIGDLKN